MLDVPQQAVESILLYDLLFFKESPLVLNDLPITFNIGTRVRQIRLLRFLRYSGRRREGLPDDTVSSRDGFSA